MHLWIIGGVALLWNIMGPFDFTMTMTKSEWYLEQFTPQQMEYFLGFPTWVVVAWGVAVWFGFFGSVSLLRRRSQAVPLFLISFVAMVITTIYNYVLTDGMEVMGTSGAIFAAVIFVVALGLVMYSRALAASGVLRRT